MAAARVSLTLDLRSDGCKLQLAFIDTGIGLSESERGQVFTRSFRGDQAQRRQIPGTGLGLNIVRSRPTAVATVESEAGVGSTFLVSLPLARRTAWASRRRGHNQR